MLYFKIYNSQLQVIEKALETASLMLGSQKSRGYCLEMICADFLAGAQFEDGGSSPLLLALDRLYSLLPDPQKVEFLRQVENMKSIRQRKPRLRLSPVAYRRLRTDVLKRDGWRCQNCGTSVRLQVHHILSRSALGGDAAENLITLCAGCHRQLHLHLDV